MASFEDLGLGEALLAALEDAGIERPTAMQAAVIPVLRREGNLVARASSGAGKTLAYGLGVLDRLAPADDADEDEGGGEGEGESAAAATGTRLLVLAPTPEAAERAALELVPYAHSAGLSVAASGGGWGTGAGEADVLAATPAEVMEAVRTSDVKLESVEAVVVDGASEIHSIGGWEILETLFDHLPRDAQRIIITAEISEAVEDLASRRVKRALRYPSTPADRATPETEPTATVGYVPVADRDKADVVARLLGGGRNGGAAPVLFCRTDERAAIVAESLALRGFLVGDPDDEDTDVVVVGASGMEGDDVPGGQVISVDVPADEETMRARHGHADPGFILVSPRELPHLRQVAQRAAFHAQPAGIAGEETVSGSVELRTFRGNIRRALREEDLAAQMLILEPLFEDFTPTEVAAAVAALLRKKAPAPAAADAMPAAAQAARAVRAPRPGATASAAASVTDTGGGRGDAFTRLFISLGERDGVRPQDLMGAIAGEADIPGSSIGKIDIRDTFSIVEVPADAADTVIGALNGTTMKGRSLRVDYDRQRKGPPGAGGGGGAPPMRRMQRGPSGGGGDRPRDDRPRRDDRDDRPRRDDRDDRPRGGGGGGNRPRPGGGGGGPRGGGGSRPGGPPRGGGGGGGFRRPRDE